MTSNNSGYDGHVSVVSRRREDSAIAVGMYGLGQSVRETLTFFLILIPLVHVAEITSTVVVTVGFPSATISPPAAQLTGSHLKEMRVLLTAAACIGTELSASKRKSKGKLIMNDVFISVLLEV